MPSQLILYHGNRLENLAEVLAEVLRQPLRSPFDRELIVVQSKGMERWISLQLATRWGICGNCEFPFPTAILQRLHGAVLGDLPERSLFDPDLLLWRILQALPEFLEASDFAPLKRYLADTEPGTLRRIQLAERIARTFDHYLVYRQDLLQRWRDQPESASESEPARWQARLWRHLTAAASDLDPVSITRRFFEQLSATGPKERTERERLPERLSVFGISYLPPLYLEVLSAVSRLVPVHLFVLNPCREYWFDIVSEARRDRRLEPLFSEPAADPDDLHLDSGHPLLASLGSQGRYFLGRAHELAAQTVELFEDPRRDTLLGRLQNAILQLEPEPAANPGPPTEDPAAPSIQVHCCHSPMREVEVLHDRLLDLFARDPSLKPADVLVMTPDIETYAPYIQAVFDAPAEDTARIPYSLSDRSARRETPEVEVLLTLLELAESRFSAPHVLDFLARPMVRTAFGIGAAELDTIVAWVRESGIRWGMDETHRQHMELPPTRENSWRAGLDSLLLGYALAPRGPELVAGISPAAGVSAGDGPLLGNLAWFVETLYRHLRSLAQPAAPAVWAKRLLELVDQFMSPDESDPIALDRLRAVVTELNDWQQVSGFSGELEGPALRWLLERRFDRGGAGFGFLGGGVTVCAMLPMRSIPFR
ncbi:MAG: exodeoxyribonuclease V subunit gamma, partial [Syntrophobacteraceae bacterium CG2_30_61_12]